MRITCSHSGDMHHRVVPGVDTASPHQCPSAHRRRARVQPEDQLAVIAGDKAADGVYALPSGVAAAAQAQYERDIARVHGGPVQSSEAEYRDFLASLGGGPPGPPGPPGAAQARCFRRHVYMRRKLAAMQYLPAQT
jgi:hypothetical protein